MAHIVIIGAGTGALPMAYQLADVARAEDRITLVSDRGKFRAAPHAPWIAPQGGGEERVAFEVAPQLQRMGIAFADTGARRLDPERNRLELGDGRFLDYDYLVIAAGPKPAFDAVEGLGPQGFTQSLCHADHVQGCKRAWERFLGDPGPLIVGAVQGASCFAPAYESAFLIESELRRRGLRPRAGITFVTSEPHIGHLGLGGMADARSLLEAELRARGIDWIANARIDRIERGRMQITEIGEAGTPARRQALAFKFAMMMPPFRGIEAVAGIDGLANANGFILVDEFLRNPAYANIFAAGVTVASAHASATPVPIEEHRTAYMVENMVNAVAQNIRDRLDGREPSQRATWSPVCLAHVGGPGLAFIAQQEPPARGIEWFAEGNWVHMSRCSACDVGG